MLTVIAVWTDTGRMDRWTDGRTDAKVVLYSVQCCTLHWTDNYASAQRGVAGGVLFLSCSSVRPCVRVRPETLLTRYLAEYLTPFHQTYTTDALWDRDERLTIWDQKVKGQGHGGIKYAGNSTFWAC